MARRTLLLPSGVDLGKTYRCLTCGRRYPEHHRARWQRHVAECAESRGERDEAHAAARDDNYFTGVADEEQYRWIRKRAEARKRGG